MDENELKHRSLETDKTFQTDGYKYLESEWFIERERIISLGKDAVEKRDVQNAAFFMAELAGFDKALKVPQVFKRHHQNFLDAELQERRNGSNANENGNH